MFPLVLRSNSTEPVGEENPVRLKNCFISKGMKTPENSRLPLGK
jgi:hypothetical protein